MKNETKTAGRISTPADSAVAGTVFAARLKPREAADLVEKVKELLAVKADWSSVALPPGFSVTPHAGIDPAELKKIFWGAALAKAAVAQNAGQSLAERQAAADPSRRNSAKNTALAATMRIFASVTGVPMSEAYHRLAGLSEIKTGGEK